MVCGGHKENAMALPEMPRHTWFLPTNLGWLLHIHISMAGAQARVAVCCQWHARP